MTVSAKMVLPLGVIVPVSIMFIDKLVYVPVLDKVKLLMFTEVDARVKAVVPKLRVLNQLPAVNTGIEVPDPVKVKLGAFENNPPEVVPTVKVRTAPAFVLNPPVPV